jgi:Sulfotransferase domain
MRQSAVREVLFVRYEDLVSSPETALERVIQFTGADLPGAILSECVRRQKSGSRHQQNPYNGYLYEPAKGSIYDILKQRQHRD